MPRIPPAGSKHGIGRRHGRNAVPSSWAFVSGDRKAQCRDQHNPSTKGAIDSHLKTRLLPAFEPLPLERIARAGIVERFDGCSRTSPGRANRALDIRSRIMNHAVA